MFANEVKTAWSSAVVQLGFDFEAFQRQKLERLHDEDDNVDDDEDDDNDDDDDDDEDDVVFVKKIITVPPLSLAESCE
jgi:hypothetical protein